MRVEMENEHCFEYSSFSSCTHLARGKQLNTISVLLFFIYPQRVYLVRKYCVQCSLAQDAFHFSSQLQNPMWFRPVQAPSMLPQSLGVHMTFAPLDLQRLISTMSSIPSSSHTRSSPSSTTSLSPEGRDSMKISNLELSTPRSLTLSIMSVFVCFCSYLLRGRFL